MPKEDFLNEKTRAEDIILGGLGFGEGVSIKHIERSEEGYKGLAVADDGEELVFESEDEITELDEWALKILLSSKFTK